MYKVLIVEDEELIRKGIQYMLDWQKHNCLIVGEAKNGHEGLALINRLAPDIVISDIKMPLMDGIDMLKQSIGNHKYKAIIISGYNEFSYAQQAISLGVTEYILKPIDFKLLSATLSKITDELYMQSIIKHELENKTLEISIPKTGNKHVNSLMNYISNNYMDKISIRDISTKEGVSCAYLNSKFKAETGYTFNDYLNRYRISQAVKLIGQNEYKIYEIAEIVGFFDYKYFVKVFKKYTGQIPSKIGDIKA